VEVIGGDGGGNRRPRTLRRARDDRVGLRAHIHLGQVKFPLRYCKPWGHSG
jgi:hypothetical protein